jgi:nitroreductase
MELDQAIRRRRMTRSFDPAPIPRSEVIELLDLARRAPSAGFTQGLSFLVLDEPGSFWDLIGGRDWFATHEPGLLSAPLLILPLADERAYTARYAEPDKAGHGLEAAERWPIPYWFTDCAMATQNLLLLAEDRGLGALFFGIFGDERALLSSLGVPDHVRPIGAVALGRRSATDRPSGSALTRRRLPLDAVVHWSRWAG